MSNITQLIQASLTASDVSEKKLLQKVNELHEHIMFIMNIYNDALHNYQHIMQQTTQN
jgi:hypothetical protein